MIKNPVAYLEPYGTKYSRMDQLKFFKGCVPQISLSPFLNTLSHMKHLRDDGSFLQKQLKS